MLPEGIRIVETGAFKDSGAQFVYVPVTAVRIESGAFRNTDVTIVLAACGENALENGAFPEGTSIIYDKEAIERWKSGDNFS